MHRITLALCMLMVLWLPGAMARTDRADARQIVAVLGSLDRMSKLGQCRELNDFVDQHSRDDDATGEAVRFYALDSLIPRPLGAFCPYHDLKASLRLAINAFEHTARLEINFGHDVMPWAWLAGALGPSWREKLADAGVIPAIQDLVAIHLYCVWKDGRRRVPFWEHLATNPRAGSRERLVDIVPVGERLLKLGERFGNWQSPSFTVAVYAEFRKLVADACAATMSRVAHRTAMRRAALMGFGSAEDIINAFE